MQILNISYNDPAVRRVVDTVCGLPYSLWHSLRMGGTGSPRLELRDGLHALLATLDRDEDRRFCSLEMRTAGVVVRFRSRLETLCIPLGWKDLEAIDLETPTTSSMALLCIREHNGERLVLAVRCEQVGAVRQLLARHVPAILNQSLKRGVA